ncbi:unnamed protein product [Mycena citricolor]|uniref:Uncharacterized protein n=1 Tax=Mycena citricolor TaxID=2018698 RepID=A0AAD2HC68_9AGAR|nr:unnamed protein product [Mycena citricolor]
MALTLGPPLPFVAPMRFFGSCLTATGAAGTGTSGSSSKSTATPSGIGEDVRPFLPPYRFMAGARTPTPKTAAEPLCGISESPPFARFIDRLCSLLSSAARLIPCFASTTWLFLPFNLFLVESTFIALFAAGRFVLFFLPASRQWLRIKFIPDRSSWYQQQREVSWPPLE